MICTLTPSSDADPKFTDPKFTDGMKKTVPTTESVECLRQFLAYKFGIPRCLMRGAKKKLFTVLKYGSVQA